MAFFELVSQLASKCRIVYACLPEIVTGNSFSCFSNLIVFVLWRVVDLVDVSFDAGLLGLSSRLHLRHEALYSTGSRLSALLVSASKFAHEYGVLRQ